LVVTPRYPEPTYGQTTFAWAWQGAALQDNQAFEIQVWREGDPPAGAHDAAQTKREGRVQDLGDGQYKLMIDIKGAYGIKGSGEYLWAVALIEFEPEYRVLAQAAPPAILRFEAGGSDGGNGGPGIDIRPPPP
jgi:hypothetical protein